MPYKHSLGAYRKSACHCGASDGIRANIQGSADHARTIVHDVEAHALRRFPKHLESRAVIFDQQCTPTVICRKADQDVAGMTVLDCVVHCLLCDVVEMSGDLIIPNQHWCVALKA